MLAPATMKVSNIQDQVTYVKDRLPDGVKLSFVGFDEGRFVVGVTQPATSDPDGPCKAIFVEGDALEDAVAEMVRKLGGGHA